MLLSFSLFSELEKLYKGRKLQKCKALANKQAFTLNQFQATSGPEDTESVVTTLEWAS
jgi:hypothetical protein